MRTTFLGASLMAAIFTLGSITTASAQSSSSQQTSTTTTSIYPSSQMAAPVTAEPMKGAVQTDNYNKKILGVKTGKSIAKTIVLQPGYGQVSLDNLRGRKDVQLTLVNPSATPLQFETTENRGKVMSAQVPAHSQTVITYSNRLTGRKDPIKFYVMQQPSNALSSNQDYVTQQSAAVATVQNTAIHEDAAQQTALLEASQQRQTDELKSSQEQALREATLVNTAHQRRTEGRSAVRGYW